MLTTPACADCLDLVASARTRQPHAALLHSAKDAAGKDLFRCTECGYRWSLGATGWSTVWD